MKRFYLSCLTALLALLAIPALAQSAADALYGKEDMAAARKALSHHMGGQTNWMLLGERLEYQSREGAPALLWDVEGWIGGDLDKFYLKSEGDYLLDDDAFEKVEIQALYSRAVSPYFDMQIGYRFDIEPDPKRHFAVIGIEGLAPHWLELEAAAFISDEGDLSARIEGEYDIFLTQRLILQPRAEFDLALQKIPELGVGSGVNTATAEMRLRYEFRREIAPYLGISWQRALGETADFARRDGEETAIFSVIAGLRFWF